LIFGRRQPKHRPDCLGVSEACGHVDGSAIGQRHHRADTGYRHQAPAHIIIPDDGQQPTMKNADLLAKRPPDNEQRFD
jgi:hypothetical protein